MCLLLRVNEHNVCWNHWRVDTSFVLGLDNGKLSSGTDCAKPRIYAKNQTTVSVRWELCCVKEVKKFLMAGEMTKCKLPFFLSSLEKSLKYLSDPMLKIAELNELA